MVKIDFKLLPCKFFYAFYYAGIWSFVAIAPHFMLQKNFSPLAFSIVSSSVPFSVIFYKPLIGNYVDQTRRHKLILSLCLLLSMVCFCLFYVIPPLKYDGEMGNYQNCISIEPNCSSMIYGFGNSTNFEILTSRKSGDELNFLKQYEFWFTLLFYNLGLGLGMLPALTLMDALTINAICGDAKMFGKQRMWMAPLGLIVMPLVGFLGDLTSYKVNGVIKINYLPNLLLLLFFNALCLFVTIFVPKPVTENPSDEVVKKVGIKATLKIFQRPSVYTFVSVSFIYGIVFGQAVVLTMVFFKEIGASQTMIYLAVSSLVVVLFWSSFFSGRIVKSVGHQQVLVLALFIMGARAILCAFTKNPWFIFITEPVLALCAAISTTNMIAFVKKQARQGYEASAQSFMNVIDEGIGCGIGIVVSGLIQEKFGVSIAWGSFGILAVSVAIIYFTISKLFSGIFEKRRNNSKNILYVEVDTAC